MKWRNGRTPWPKEWARNERKLENTVQLNGGKTKQNLNKKKEWDEDIDGDEDDEQRQNRHKQKPALAQRRTP